MARSEIGRAGLTAACPLRAEIASVVCQKQGATSQSFARRHARRAHKKMLRPQICADEARDLSRGREKRLQPSSTGKVATVRSHNGLGLRAVQKNRFARECGGMADHSSATWSKIKCSAVPPAMISTGERRHRCLRQPQAALSSGSLELRRPWLSPHGSRWRPSAPATGSHKARARSPLDDREWRPSALA